MDVKDIKRLLDALAASEVREFSYETEEYKLNVKRGPEPVVTQTVAAVPQSAPQAAQPASAVQGPAPAESAAAAAPASRGPTRSRRTGWK